MAINSPYDSIDEVNTALTEWKAAEKACAGGQSFRLSSGGGDRQLTMADLAEIRAQLQYLSGERAKFRRFNRPATVIGRPSR